jgi:hypothetical protein
LIASSVYAKPTPLSNLSATSQGNSLKSCSREDSPIFVWKNFRNGCKADENHSSTEADEGLTNNHCGCLMGSSCDNLQARHPSKTSKTNLSLPQYRCKVTYSTNDREHLPTQDDNLPPPNITKLSCQREGHPGSCRPGSNNPGYRHKVIKILPNCFEADKLSSVLITIDMIEEKHLHRTSEK